MGFPGGLTHQEIAAWASLRRVNLQQWELDALCMMDDRRMSIWAEQERRKNDEKEEWVVSERPLTPALFDAIITGPSRSEGI